MLTPSWQLVDVLQCTPHAVFSRLSPPCRHPDSMLCILWLGSSVGNLQPDEAVHFFRAAQAAAGHKTQVRPCSGGAKPKTAAVHVQPTCASLSCLARQLSEMPVGVCWVGCL